MFTTMATARPLPVSGTAGAATTAGSGSWCSGRRRMWPSCSYERNVCGGAKTTGKYISAQGKTMSYQIRPATPADLDQILELFPRLAAFELPANRSAED